MRKNLRGGLKKNEKYMGYIYRREAGAEMGFGGDARFPSLYMTHKLKPKTGVCFPNAPMFKYLRDNDLEEYGGKIGKNNGVSGNGKMKKKYFDKEVGKIDKKDEKMKLKRKEKKDPTCQEIRNHMKKMAKFHKREHYEARPCIYPILGGGASDEEGGSDDDAVERIKSGRNLHTKMQLKSD